MCYGLRKYMELYLACPFKMLWWRESAGYSELTTS
jgi:hypothetical protein